jgi:hypothetical protein
VLFVLLLTLGISYVPGYLEAPPQSHVHAKTTFSTTTNSLRVSPLKNSHHDVAHQRLQGIFHETAKTLPVVNSFILSRRGTLSILPIGSLSIRYLILRTLRI